ncbi:uncharacterized protein LOC144168204 [Haemaphysalis longicornis]
MSTSVAFAAFMFLLSTTTFRLVSSGQVDLQCVDQFRLCEQSCVYDATTSWEASQCTKDCELKHDCNQPSCHQEYDESKCLHQAPFETTCFVDAACPVGSRCCPVGDDGCTLNCAKLF